jgi:hypothetical protein
MRKAKAESQSSATFLSLIKGTKKKEANTTSN